MKHHLLTAGLVLTTLIGCAPSSKPTLLEAFPSATATLLRSPTPTYTATQTAIPLQISSTQTVNIRQAPSLQSKVIGKLPVNQLFNVVAKSEDGQWFQILYPNSSSPGWVSATVVNISGSTNQLPIFATQAPITPTTLPPLISSPSIGGTLCADGWISHSTGRGTCSHHKGIAGRSRRR